MLIHPFQLKKKAGLMSETGHREEEDVNEGGMGQLRDPDLGCKKTGHPKSHHASGTDRIP